MPILATGSRYAASDAGFSLVELLAVLAIVSLMVGAVVVSMPRAPSALDVETQAMTDRVQAFLRDGELAGDMRALGLDADGLVLFRHDGLEWQQSARIDWPDDARLRVEVDGDRRTLSDTALPDLLFEPYGDVPDIALTLSGRNATYVVSPDETGRMTREVRS